MNDDTAAGKFDQLKGKVKQSLGETFGDQELANSGAADEVKGAAKETWGNTKDAASIATSDAHTDAQIHKENAEQHASADLHNVREKITTAAQHLKESINEHLDHFKAEHK